jgi:hypothetical protein
MSGEQLGSRLLTDLAYTQPGPLQYEDNLFRRNERIGERGSGSSQTHSQAQRPADEN